MCKEYKETERHMRGIRKEGKADKETQKRRPTHLVYS